MEDPLAANTLHHVPEKSLDETCQSFTWDLISTELPNAGFVYHAPQESQENFLIECTIPHSAQTCFRTLTNIQCAESWLGFLTQIRSLGKKEKCDFVYVRGHKLSDKKKGWDLLMQRSASFQPDAGLYKMKWVPLKDLDHPPLQNVVRVENFQVDVEISSRGDSECALRCYLSISADDILRPSIPTGADFPAKSAQFFNKIIDKLSNACRRYNSNAKGGLVSATIPVEIKQHNPRLTPKADGFMRSPSLADSSSVNEDRVPPSTVDIEVCFEDDVLGLTLEAGFYNDTAIVSHVEKGSQAYRARPQSKDGLPVLPRLVPGLLVSEVNNNSMKSLDYKQIIATIRAAKRPLIVGFDFPRLRRRLLPKIHEAGELSSQSRLGTLSFVIKASMPMPSRLESFSDGTGCVLMDDIKGAAISTRGSSSNNLDRFLPFIKEEDEVIPAGQQIISINDYDVTKLSHEKILKLLCPSQKPKTVVIGPSANRKRVKSKRSIFGRLLSKESLVTNLGTSPDDANGDHSVKDAEQSSSAAGNQEEGVYVPPSMKGKLLPMNKLSVNHLKEGLDSVLLLFSEERILAAGDYLDKLNALLEANKNDERAKSIHTKMETVEEIKLPLERLSRRLAEVKAALKDFNGDAGGWIFGHKFLGVSTYYKPGEDNTIWLKLEGIVDDVEIFYGLAVVRETSLFHRWAPFCNRSYLLRMLSRCELVTYFNISVPLTVQRDAVIHAYAVDTTYEENCIMVLASSVDSHEGVDIPPVEGWNADRMRVRGFRALVEPLSRRSARMCLVANVDPRLLLPKNLLNFMIKKMAGVLLYLLQQEAKKVEQSGDDNPYKSAIAEDKDGFYGWLRPKMEEFFLYFEERVRARKILRPAGDELAKTTPEWTSKASIGERSSASKLIGNKPLTQHAAFTGLVSCLFLQILVQPSSLKMSISTTYQSVLYAAIWAASGTSLQHQNSFGKLSTDRSLSAFIKHGLVMVVVIFILQGLVQLQALHAFAMRRLNAHIATDTMHEDHSALFYSCYQEWSILVALIYVSALHLQSTRAELR